MHYIDLRSGLVSPAGRFLAQRCRNTLGEDVVWVDYDAAISIHRVRATEPKERRLKRMASTTMDDNRVSCGCINVPVAFYEAFVLPMTLAARRPVVYVLPEERSVEQVFGSYGVASQRARPRGLASRGLDAIGGAGWATR